MNIPRESFTLIIKQFSFTNIMYIYIYIIQKEYRVIIFYNIVI